MKDYGDAAMTAFEWLGMTGLSAEDLLLNYKLYGSFDKYESMDKCRLSFPNYDEVHLAFKSKMKEVHPDKGGTTELAKAVNHACCPFRPVIVMFLISLSKSTASLLNKMNCHLVTQPCVFPI